MLWRKVMDSKVKDLQLIVKTIQKLFKRLGKDRSKTHKINIYPNLTSKDLL